MAHHWLYGNALGWGTLYMERRSSEHAIEFIHMLHRVRTRLQHLQKRLRSDLCRLLHCLCLSCCQMMLRHHMQSGGIESYTGDSIFDSIHGCSSDGRLNHGWCPDGPSAPHEDERCPVIHLHEPKHLGCHCIVRQQEDRGSPKGINNAREYDVQSGKHVLVKVPRCPCS